jgi:hypothetical protein
MTIPLAEISGWNVYTIESPPRTATATEASRTVMLYTRAFIAKAPENRMGVWPVTVVKLHNDWSNNIPCIRIPTPSAWNRVQVGIWLIVVSGSFPTVTVTPGIALVMVVSLYSSLVEASLKIDHTAEAAYLEHNIYKYISWIHFMDTFHGYISWIHFMDTIYTNTFHGYKYIS